MAGIIDHSGTAEQTAEKGLFCVKRGEKHASGAKAQRSFCCVCGATEVVPFQNPCWRQSFSAGCEAVPFQNKVKRNSLLEHFSC
jgi:hypothetical protein